MSKTKKAIFTFSIILNILLLGITSGMAYKRHHNPQWQPFKERLTPETQALVDKNFEQAREKIRPSLSALMKEREALIAVMNREPFDAKEFDGTTKRIQKIQKDISDAKAGSIKSLMSEVPYTERIKLTENLARFFTWDRGKGQRKNAENGFEKPGPVERVP